MGPIWGWQDPGGPHVGSINLAIWDIMNWDYCRSLHTTATSHENDDISNNQPLECLFNSFYHNHDIESLPHNLPHQISSTSLIRWRKCFQLSPENNKASADQWYLSANYGNYSTNQRPGNDRNSMEHDQKLIRLGEAHDELTDQIWAKSNQQCICHCAEITWNSRIYFERHFETPQLTHCI